jgi:opacity protein-like surface antigen
MTSTSTQDLDEELEDFLRENLDEHGFGPTVGVGLRFHFTDHVSVRVDWDYRPDFPTDDAHSVRGSLQFNF